MAEAGPSPGMDANDLSSLFTYLIDLCSSKSDVNEQQSIAQIIRPAFTKELESSPSFYRFLNPLANTPKKPKKIQSTNKSKGVSLIFFY